MPYNFTFALWVKANNISLDDNDNVKSCRLCFVPANLESIEGPQFYQNFLTEISSHRFNDSWRGYIGGFVDHQYKIIGHNLFRLHDVIRVSTDMLKKVL